MPEPILAELFQIGNFTKVLNSFKKLISYLLSLLAPYLDLHARSQLFKKSAKRIFSCIGVLKPAFLVGFFLGIKTTAFKAC